MLETTLLQAQCFLNVFENCFWNLTTHLVDVSFKVQKAWHIKFSLESRAAFLADAPSNIGENFHTIGDGVLTQLS